MAGGVGWAAYLMQAPRMERIERAALPLEPRASSPAPPVTKAAATASLLRRTREDGQTKIVHAYGTVIAASLSQNDARTAQETATQLIAYVEKHHPLSEATLGELLPIVESLSAAGDVDQRDALREAAAVSLGQDAAMQRAFAQFPAPAAGGICITCRLLSVPEETFEKNRSVFDDAQQITDEKSLEEFLAFVTAYNDALQPAARDQRGLGVSFEIEPRVVEKKILLVGTQRLTRYLGSTRTIGSVAAAIISLADLVGQKPALGQTATPHHLVLILQASAAPYP